MSLTAPHLVQPKYLIKLTDLLRQIRNGLIVSCQAEYGEPLYGASHMAAMAVAAMQGGAVGIRANTPEDISSIRKAVTLPIIGLYKQDIPGFSVRITPTLEAAMQVASAGADIIAFDATSRPHPDGLSLDERIRLIHTQLDCPVMADISTYAEGLAAQNAGADLVSTTLAGYTGDTPVQDLPDLELVRNLASNLRLPVVAEGRITTPEQAAQALALGACAVVVGSAITRPKWITARFVQRIARP